MVSAMKAAKEVERQRIAFENSTAPDGSKVDAA